MNGKRMFRDEEIRVLYFHTTEHSIMAATVIKFEKFELDRDRYELRREGRVLKLEKKPMELLILLVSKNGSLLTRPEIIEHLWGQDVFVDTEHGINTAIRKIRYALRDDPELPRFIQTVTARGYRFIAPVTESGEGPPSLTAISPAEAIPEVNPGPSSSGPVSIGPNSSDRASIEEQTAANKPRPDRGKIYRVAAAAALVLITTGFVALGLNHGWRNRLGSANPQIETLAVLPLDNLSGDPAQDYFADGMTDELITMLAKNSTLKIISRTSAMQYKGVHRPLPDIARELGADAILEGSVEKSGNSVHMTIQLIHAATDQHMWAESYDRDLTGAVSLPGDAARAIALKLKKAVPDSGPQRYINPEAHDAYLRGQYYWFANDFSNNNNEKAGGYFRTAIEIQPDYAAAWSGLANFYASQVLLGTKRFSEVSTVWEAAARKAVDLDDTLPEAHNSMAGFYLLAAWDWEKALAESQRATELNPNYAEAYYLRSYIFIALNRMQDALEAAKKSVELDPYARPDAIAFVYVESHQFDAAVREAQLRLEALPGNDDLHGDLAEAYLFKGMDKQAAEEQEKAQMLGGDKAGAAETRQAFDRGGSRAVQEVSIRNWKKVAEKGYISPIFVAYLYARLGRKDEAIALLEKAYDEHNPLLIFLQHFPDYYILHSDERYRALVKKVGLPPAF